MRFLELSLTRNVFFNKVILTAVDNSILKLNNLELGLIVIRQGEI